MNEKHESTSIKRVLKGDRDAYAILIDKYKGPVFNLAYRMTGNHQDAEDLAQETFIKAYEALGTFNREKRFFPWLYAIALNLVRNHVKKQRMSLSLGNNAPEWNISQNDRGNPEKTAFLTQEREELVFCLQSLPLDLKEAVILRFYQDLSFEDISEILGVSLSGAKMRVYRGLDRLRGLMKREEK